MAVTDKRSLALHTQQIAGWSYQWTGTETSRVHAHSSDWRIGIYLFDVFITHFIALPVGHVSE